MSANGMNVEEMRQHVMALLTSLRQLGAPRCAQYSSEKSRTALFHDCVLEYVFWMFRDDCDDAQSGQSP
jgi:hypothetical protein